MNLSNSLASLRAATPAQAPSEPSNQTLPGARMAADSTQLSGDKAFQASLNAAKAAFASGDNQAATTALQQTLEMVNTTDKAAEIVDAWGQASGYPNSFAAMSPSLAPAGQVAQKAYQKWLSLSTDPVSVWQDFVSEDKGSSHLLGKVAMNQKDFQTLGGQASQRFDQLSEKKVGAITDTAAGLSYAKQLQPFVGSNQIDAQMNATLQKTIGLANNREQAQQVLQTADALQLPDFDDVKAQAQTKLDSFPKPSLWSTVSSFFSRL